MFVLKYFVLQVVIVGIAFVAYFWGKEIGVGEYLSEIVFASVVAYFLVLLMYRREYIQRAKEEKKSFHRVSQPWE
jgi:uncharacterized membrane protein